MVNENIFRAYDIRGKADEDLNDEIIRKIGIVLSEKILKTGQDKVCLLYTSPSPRDPSISRMPSSA